MKKVLLFVGFVFYYTFANAVGFLSNNPGYIVNGLDSNSRKPGISLLTEQRDQLLTVPVFIKFKNSGREVARCTGTLVGNKYVMTAKHCFRNTLLTSSVIKQDWQEVPVNQNEYSAMIMTYTGEALFNHNWQEYGAYKFTSSGKVYSELTPYYQIGTDSNLEFMRIPEDNFELITVISINTLSKGTDIVLLTLRSTPKIVADQIIKPEDVVEFGSYQSYFINETRQIENSRQFLPEEVHNNLEFMGFGHSGIETINDGDKNKIHLNLRSSVPPRVNYFFPHQVLSTPDLRALETKYSLELNKYFFIITFPAQSADDGDSGAAFSYTDGDKKKIIGVVSLGSTRALNQRRQGELSSGVYTIFISGLNDGIIQKLEELRHQ